MVTRDLLSCLGLAAIAGALMLAWRARAPLGADEGYLWYGVQQWRKGRLPHRDFKSYEPGRYVWLGVWSRMFGPGLLALRISTHAFFALGLAAALLALRTQDLPWTAVGATAIALALLSYPQHKQFEHGATLLAWAVFSALWAFPSPVTAGCAGAVVGLSLFLGFNLFLYFATALVLLLGAGLGLGAITLDRTVVAALAGGGLLGLSPFGWLCRHRGFARNFHQRRVVTVLSRGESNLSLPLPWPWRAAPPQLRGLGRARTAAFQYLFLALIALPLVALASASMAPAAHGALLPAAMLGLCVAHHASSRADPAHILQSAGAPCVLAVQACGAHPWLVVLLAAASLWLVWPLQPQVQRRRQPARFVRRDAGGWMIDTPLTHARVLDAVVRLRTGIRDAALYAAPAYPALYARLALDAPVYDTFSLYAASTGEQQAMIADLVRTRVGMAIVSDAPVDGREDLRFSATHPMVWKHLRRHYAMRPVDLGRDVHVFIHDAPATADGESSAASATAMCATAP